MYTETAKEIKHALWTCALSKMGQICIVFILTTVNRERWSTLKKRQLEMQVGSDYGLRQFEIIFPSIFTPNGARETYLCPLV